MTELNESDIVRAEERLRQAMRVSNVDELDVLISPQLIFTNHLGQVFGKDEDLAGHRSGVLRFHALDPSDMRIRMHDGLAIVSVRMAVVGAHAGAAFAADLRFTRVWRQTRTGSWEVIAGHASQVQA